MGMQKLIDAEIRATTEAAYLIRVSSSEPISYSDMPDGLWFPKSAVHVECDHSGKPLSDADICADDWIIHAKEQEIGQAILTLQV